MKISDFMPECEQLAQTILAHPDTLYILTLTLAALMTRYETEHAKQR